MHLKTLLLAALLAVFGAATIALAADPKDTKAKPAAEKKAEKAAAQIDINRAKADELMTLDGIGEARAAAIIKGRPYRAKDELVDNKILPQAVYDKIKDKIIAHQVPAKKK
jgi:competence protein ComEA